MDCHVFKYTMLTYALPWFHYTSTMGHFYKGSTKTKIVFYKLPVCLLLQKPTGYNESKVQHI